MSLHWGRGHGPGHRNRRTQGKTSVAYLPTLASAPVYVRANKKLISSYSGFAARAASGPTNLTFDDVSALSSITLIDTAYDQSGLGNNSTQLTVGAQPAYTPNGKIGGTPTIAMVLPFSGTQNRLAIPASVAVSRQDHSVFMVLLPTISLAGNSLMSLDISAAAASAFYTDPSIANLLRYTPNASLGLQQSAQPIVIGFSSGPSVHRWWARGQTGTVAAYAAGSLVGGTDGWATAFSGYPAYNYTAAMIVYPTALSQVDGQAVVDFLTAKYLIETSFTKRVVFDGDSLMQGSVAAASGDMPTIISSISWPANIERFNLGIAGQQESDSTTAFAARFNQHIISTFGGTITIIQANGTNDIQVGGQTDIQVAARDDAFLAAIRARATAQGITVKAGIATIAPRADAAWTGTMEIYRLAVNTRRKTLAGGSGQTWDFYVDVDGTITGAGILPTNTTYYFSDKLHWTKTMYNNIVGPAYRTALLAAGSI